MAKKTMHAAVVTAFGKPLTLQEWEIPTPGPGKILVKTEACGVCHTDLHAAKGDWPLKPTLPFIPGHEAIGLVVALGAGATIVKQYSQWPQAEYSHGTPTRSPSLRLGDGLRQGRVRRLH